MDAKFKINNPKPIVFTMELSMSLSEWEELSSQLEEKWPSWQLSQNINSAVSKIKQVYYSDEVEL